MTTRGRILNGWWIHDVGLNNGPTGASGDPGLASCVSIVYLDRRGSDGEQLASAREYKYRLDEETSVELLVAHLSELAKAPHTGEHVVVVPSLERWAYSMPYVSRDLAKGSA